MNFAQLRDALLALAPLDADHVRAVNKAEAAFWKRSEGYRVDWSDKILGALRAFAYTRRARARARARARGRARARTRASVRSVGHERTNALLRTREAHKDVKGQPRSSASSSIERAAGLAPSFLSRLLHRSGT
eukprot:979776-Pleurochrysis_carterae.AAC.1